MELLHVTANIEYGRFELADLEEMSSVLAESFSLGEPMAVATGFSHQDIRAIVNLFGPKAAAERLTIVARNPGGSLVGALLAQDFATPPPEGLEQVAEAFHPIGALLDGLDDEYRSSREILQGTHLHLFMIGVLPAFGGQKIAQNLLAVCLSNGAARGYKTAVTEATGALSQHIFRKAGFVDQQIASYADFVFDAKHVFRSIKNPSGTVLMDKQLD
jgi:ribosomal protein S18 acetylase RimI-like enzyme